MTTGPNEHRARGPAQSSSISASTSMVMYTVSPTTTPPPIDLVVPRHAEAVLNLHFTSHWLYRVFQEHLKDFDISNE
jgi:hypothetical protein